MISTRLLTREEVPQVWTIDRREVVEHIYVWENGRLERRVEYWDVQDWPPGEPEKYTPILLDCFEHGGWFQGLFDNGKLVAVAVLDNHFIGREHDWLQLKFLHVSADYRGQGLGAQLFRAARAEAGRRGARRMYISATPSEHTIHFYLGLGCWVCEEPDPELFALEPEDIHLLCEV